MDKETSRRFHFDYNGNVMLFDFACNEGRKDKWYVYLEQGEWPEDDILMQIIKFGYPKPGRWYTGLSIYKDLYDCKFDKKGKIKDRKYRKVVLNYNLR